MAIDTRDKRSSAMGLGLQSIRMLPDPDSTVNIPEDGRHVAGIYRATLSAPAGGVIPVLVVSYRRRRVY